MQTKEGITQDHAKGKVPSIPDFTTINRRINKLDIQIKYTTQIVAKNLKMNPLSLQYMVLALRLPIEINGYKINGI
jgi:hypothetical protein